MLVVLPLEQNVAMVDVILQQLMARQRRSD